MPTPKKHALLSASSSHRWLNCTAAPHYEEQFPDKETTYTAKGTLAHKFCEEIANYNFHVITKRTFTGRWNKLQKDELFEPEMIRRAELYGQYLWEKYMGFSTKPFVAVEVEVQYNDYAPEGFGTSDCIMIGDGRLCVIDYKNGYRKVEAANNPQMRLYALGALKKYTPIFGDSIKTVSTAILQPEISDVATEEELSVADLLLWGENIKPIAQRAYDGPGDFNPGPWCHFCKGKPVCRARSENATALEDFKDLSIAGKMTEQERLARNTEMVITGKAPPVLSDAEVADLIRRGEGLVAWYEDLKNYALQAILDGRVIPGFRVVAGVSRRAFSDTDKALEAIQSAGYDEAVLYERKPKSLAELEKMIGKTNFAEIVGSLIVKPLGKPTLVGEGDKRPDYSDAARDFQNVGHTGA